MKNTHNCFNCMNILFIVGKYPDDGGVAKVSEVLADGLRGRGHGITIGSFIHDKNNNGVVETLELESPVSSYSNLEILKSYVAEKNIDIIVCQWATDFRVSRLCRKAIKNTHCKLISVLHTAPGRTGAIQKSLDILNGDLTVIKRVLERGKLLVQKQIAKRSLQLTLSYSDYFLSLSPSLLKEVQTFLGQHSEHKVGYIYNPITIADQGKVDYINKNNVVLFVGRLDNGTKKVIRTLQVWHLIWQNHQDWKFCIVGDGPDKKELEDYVNANKISNVEFVGYVSPETYYRKAKILLLTSSYEGFPLVLGEAMTNGVIPVVLGSFVSVKDIIHNGKDGVVVEMPFEEKRFASVLTSLMSDERYLEQLSKEAQERAKEFLLPFVLDEWESLFSKLYKS